MKTALIIAFGIICLAGSVSRSDEIQDKAKEFEVFTPEYLERINTNQQDQDQQAELQRKRNDKMRDFMFR